MKTRIVIVDDHQVVLDGLSAMIKSLRDFSVIGTCTDGWELIEFAEQHEVDMILMDISMPKLDGIETMKELKKRKIDVPVVILSMHLSLAYAKELLALGIMGYLPKDCNKDELVDALRAVKAGETYISSSLSDLLVQQGFSTESDKAKSLSPKISNRETQILELIHKEHPTREIAQILGISFNTVETHRRHLLNKFAVKSTVGLIREAMRAGILD